LGARFRALLRPKRFPKITTSKKPPKIFFSISSHLLDNLTESIEISYNSAGVLAHLVSDGDERWAESGVNIPREDVNRKIVKVF